MPQSTGYLTIHDERHALVEIDTITCCHCCKIVKLNERDGTKLPPPPWCLLCAKCQCQECAATGECVPLERKLARAEARAISLRSMGF